MKRRRRRQESIDVLWARIHLTVVFREFESILGKRMSRAREDGDEPVRG